MDEIAESTLKTMIDLYKKREIYVNFVSFQTNLTTLKNEICDFEKENPQFDFEVDRIIQEIERYQTTRYKNYLLRFYETKICKIKSTISRLKSRALLQKTMQEKRVE